MKEVDHISKQFHAAQISVLYSLRRSSSRRFAELMKPTGLSSDSFKFHLRNLCADGLVMKDMDGSYRLTHQGKEIANNLDEHNRKIQKQPKLSVLTVVQHPIHTDYYLFQKRLRNPYYDFWGCIGGAVQWGESAEQTAARELSKQTGLTGEFKVRSFYRKRDYASESKLLLEDKLFVVLEATSVYGNLSNDWTGGHNAWLTIEEFKSKDKYFVSSHEIISMIRDGMVHESKAFTYTVDEY